MKDLLTKKQYFVEGWSSTEWSSSTPRPTYKKEDFIATFPTASGHLAVRQEWLKSKQEQLNLQPSLERLSTIVKVHDSAFNPSEIPYIVGETRKRVAEETANAENAKEIPEGDGDDAKTLDDFLKKNKGTVVLLRFGQTFLFTLAGQLWCWGETDDIVDINLPLAQIYGKFVMRGGCEGHRQGKHVAIRVGVSRTSRGSGERCRQCYAPGGFGHYFSVH